MLKLFSLLFGSVFIVTLICEMKNRYKRELSELGAYDWHTEYFNEDVEGLSAQRE